MALSLTACIGGGAADGAICTSAHEATRIWASDGPSEAALDAYEAEARMIAGRATEAERRRIRRLAVIVRDGVDKLREPADVNVVRASRAITDLTTACPSIGR